MRLRAAVAAAALLAHAGSQRPPARRPTPGACQSGGVGECGAPGAYDEWLANASHPTAGLAARCSMPVLDAAGLGVLELAAACARAVTPLLIRGLLRSPAWAAWASGTTVLTNRSSLLRIFGGEPVGVSVAPLLGYGPEARSAELDAKRLGFITRAWPADGSTFRDGLLGQAAPTPVVELREFAAALRGGAMPPDAYCFSNVSGRPLTAPLAPHRALWRATVLAQQSAPEREAHAWALAESPVAADLPDTGLLQSLTRLGLGGTGSGVPWHGHVLAFNLVFAGRKRWLVRGASAAAVPGLKNDGPADLLERVLPSTAFGEVWRRLEGEDEAWECTQQAGEAVLVPEKFIHTIVNLEETLAFAVQGEAGGLPNAAEALAARADDGGAAGTRAADALLQLLLRRRGVAVAGESEAQQSGDGDGIDAPDTHGQTALHDAVWLGAPAVVQALLRRGADPDAATVAGVTPLQLAAVRPTAASNSTTALIRRVPFKHTFSLTGARRPHERGFAAARRCACGGRDAAG
jgi:hypothetical protein